MATGVSAAAPGKVILSGEYAVVSCAPALVTAVNRQVTSTFSPHPAPDLEISEPRPVIADLTNVTGIVPMPDDRLILVRSDAEAMNTRPDLRLILNWGLGE